MRDIPVTSAGDIAPSTVNRLRAELGERRTLGDVLAWGRAQQPPRAVTDIVTQDEYTHDVLIDLAPRLCLVFDVTCLGAVTAVAVFDHQPDAAELLAARLARGWHPTPSHLRDGDRVLGYAACAVTGEHQPVLPDS